MVRGKPRHRQRSVARLSPQADRPSLGHMAGGRRSGAVLRMDRQRPLLAGWRAFGSAHHSAAQAQRVERGQHPTFAELDKLGLVHPSGRAAFEARDEARSQIYAYENRATALDEARETEFRRHKSAWKFFESQAPWYRRTASYWVMSAKREETKDKRLSVLIAHSKSGERVPPLRRPSPR